AHDGAAADNRRAQTAHQRYRLFNGSAAADNVIDDDAGIDIALIDVLAEHALTAFLLGPVNLLRAQCVADAEGYGYATGTGTDDRNLGQLAGDVPIDPKLATERHGQNARRVVVAKGQRHLKIVGRVLAVGIDKVSFAKRAGLGQNLHYLFGGRNQLHTLGCHRVSSVIIGYGSL